MGLKNVLKTASMGVREMDAERLTDRFIALGLQPLSELEPRLKATVCGEVKRI